MLLNNIESMIPDYKGLEWQGLNLPKEVCHWQAEAGLASCEVAYDTGSDFTSIKKSKWRWPDKDIVVFTDLHADGHAFVSSLIASGYIEKFGPHDSDFRLTGKGRKCRFVINGDCFDKGPSNLSLLRLIKQLMDQKASIKIIAGNHDIRFAIGIRALEMKANPLMSHLFIRMAPKGASFFKEVYEEYVLKLSRKERQKLGENLSDDEVRSRLYPGVNWQAEFCNKAEGIIRPKKMVKEITNAYAKQQRFEDRCKELGLSLPQAYAAIQQWQKLFLSKKGEFSWFFKNMQLMYEKGSFLFMHAGVDDVIARQLKKKGVDYLNKKFHKVLKKDPFSLYYGPMGNVFRTKYREGDHEFTQRGAQILKQCGYKAIVQGHCNRHQGQQLVMRHGLLNFECDASLDIDTRTKEGLSGRGAAATLIKSSGVVLGISVDYPFIKAYIPDNKSAQYIQ